MFIVFEGPDGSGKTTQLIELVKYLKDLGCEFVLTREPGGTKIGDRIRKVLHDLRNTNMSSWAEVFGYQMSRAQHVHEIIRPALEEGKIVLCDRFRDSSVVYQGHALGLGMAAIEELNNYSTQRLYPDVTIYLRLKEAATGLSRRMRDSQAEWNRLDARETEFHQRVIEGYDLLYGGKSELGGPRPGTIIIVNAERPIEEISEEIKQEINHLLSGRETEGNIKQKERLS